MTGLARATDALHAQVYGIMQEFMAKCGDAGASPHLSQPTALPELKAREGGEFREGPPPNTQGGFGGRGGCGACCIMLLLDALLSSNCDSIV